MYHVATQASYGRVVQLIAMKQCNWFGQIAHAHSKRKERTWPGPSHASHGAARNAGMQTCASRPSYAA